MRAISLVLEMDTSGHRAGEADHCRTEGRREKRVKDIKDMAKNIWGDEEYQWTTQRSEKMWVTGGDDLFWTRRREDEACRGHRGAKGGHE